MLAFSPVFEDADLADRAAGRTGPPARHRAATDAVPPHDAIASMARSGGGGGLRQRQRRLARTPSAGDGPFETHEKVLAAVAYRNVLPLASARSGTMVGDQIPTPDRPPCGGAGDRLTRRGRRRARHRGPGRQAGAADVKARGPLAAEDGSPPPVMRGLAQAHDVLRVGRGGVGRGPHHRTWLMIHDAGRWASGPSMSGPGCRRASSPPSAPRWTPITPWNSMAARGTSNASRNTCCSASSPA